MPSASGKLARLAIPGAAVACAAVTLYLGYALNLWTDEGYTMDTTGAGPLRALGQAVGFEAQAPAYFVLLSIWRWLHASPFFARVFSALCVVASLPLLARAARAYLGREGALPAWAAATACLHPLVIYSGVELRCYALSLLLGAGLILAFHRAYLADEPPLPRHRVVHLLLAVLSVYNQYYAGLLLVGNFVALLLLRQPPRLLLRYLLDMAGVALALIPLVAMLSRQLGAYDAIAGDTGLGLALKSAYWRAADLLLPCAESPLLGPRKWILRALLLLALLGGLRARRRLAGQPGLLALLATSGMSLLMLAALTMKLGNEMVDFRHTAFLLAPLLLAALGLARAALGGRAVAGYALLVILFSLISLAYTYRPMAKTGDWQRLAGYLAAQESAGQPILFYKAGAVLAFRAYYRGINPVHPLPAEPKLDQWNPTSDILTGEAEVRRRIDSLRGGGAERFWLVMDDARQYSGITYSHAMLERLTAACCERVKGQRFYRGQATLFRWRAP